MTIDSSKKDLGMLTMRLMNGPIGRAVFVNRLAALRVPFGGTGQGVGGSSNCCNVVPEFEE